MLKRIVRGTLMTMAALVAAIVLLVIAWVVSNWGDAPPVPRPAALALPVPTVADERNAFFTLIGLRAPAAQEPMAAGMAQWRARLAEAGAPAAATPPSPPAAGWWSRPRSHTA